MSKTPIEQEKQTALTPPDGFYDIFYLKEVMLQCEFVLRSFGEMQQAYAINKRHPSILAAAHMLLVFASNVCKLLTSTKKATAVARARSKRLTALLSAQNMDFTQIVNARNFLEHFDERLDRCLHNFDGVLVHRMVNDRGIDEITLEGYEMKVQALQYFNTSNLMLNLYNESFSIGPIVERMQIIKDRAAAAVEKLEKNSKPAKPTGSIGV